MPGASGALTGAEAVRQVLLGVLTWGVLLAVLRRAEPLLRVQCAIVVVLATLVEYTFSPLLEAYAYRIGTVPFYVPPGHGLVYLAAWSLGETPWVRRHERAATVAVAVVGGAWALAGLAGLLHGRHDVLGAFWFGCLLAFLRWGPSRRLYIGAFVVVGYLELVGTALGTWRWAAVDPVLGVIGQGNPPSGAAGGYGWFDLYALLAAPAVLRLLVRLRARLRERLPGARRRDVRPEQGQDLLVQKGVGGQGAAPGEVVVPVD